MKLEINNNLERDSLNNNYYYGVDFKENNLEERLREGVRLAQQGDRAKARHLLLSVAQAEPGNETAWLWLASISEYPEELLIFLQNVLKVNPENERAIEWAKETKSLLAKTFVHRGIDASHQNQIDFARQCFLQAIVHEAENEMAWLWLASMTEAVEEKMLYLQKVLNFNPQNETALTSLTELKKQTVQAQLRKANSAAISGDKAAAGVLLEEIMQNSPELEEAWILKAYLTDGFYEKINCYEKVLELNPQNEAAQAGMASLKILMEKVENQPDISQQIAELNNETQTSTYASEPCENTQENHTDVFEKPSQSDIYEVQPIEQSYSEESSDVEELPEFSDSVELVEETEAATSNDDYSENYLIDDTQIPNSESSLSENNFAEEATSNFTEDEHFHSESPTQKLEEIKPEEAQYSFSAEPEIELIETHSDETPSFTQVEDADFSLEVEEEEDTENPPVNDTQLSNSYNSNLSPNPYNSDFSEESQNSFASLHEVEENSFETEVSAHSNADPEEETASSEFAANDTYKQLSTEQYFADYNQPTVEFSYTEVSPVSSEQISADSSVEAYAFEDYSYDSPAVEEPAAEETEFSSPAVSESSEVYSEAQTPAANTNCPFCGFSNESQTISCGSCRTMLSLSDLEMLLAHQEADQGILAQSIEIMEEEKSSRRFDANDLYLLAVAYLNAKSLRKGLETLQEASKLNPNDVVLSSKINFLAIRISEIELQENKNQEHASISRMIMVVDDSATVRKLISGKLEKSGHSVVTAVDGIEALSKINEAVPDLILLDITMPQMDGYQVCKMIRSNEATKDVPVVMISGKDGFFDKVRGRMAGSTDYITKPFGPETLMRTVETYLN